MVKRPSLSSCHITFWPSRPPIPQDNLRGGRAAARAEHAWMPRQLSFFLPKVVT